MAFLEHPKALIGISTIILQTTISFDEEAPKRICSCENLQDNFTMQEVF